MSEVKELAQLLKEVENQLAPCMRCGMCQAYCPLFGETGLEPDVARGKLSILDGTIKEMLKDPEGTRKRINRCLLCGSCEANCPSGVRVMEIFLKARTILAGYKGLSLVKRLLLKGMLSKPRRFDRLTEWAASLQVLFTRPANRIMGTSRTTLELPMLGNRHFKPLAPVPFHSLVPELNTEPGSSGIKVAFYVGCLIDKLFPHVAQATIDVLNYHQVGIFMPGEQGCCGIPALSSGDIESFLQLVLHNLQIFDVENFDYFLTSCATCTSTIKKIWPIMFETEDWKLKEKAEIISRKTMDINQFLVSKIGLDNKETRKYKDAAWVSYHDPCHLAKSLGIRDEPREIINANPCYHLVEMNESDWCCGMGGSFNLEHYDTSRNIGNRKLKNIRDSGCSTVATGCPACMIQLYDVLSRSGENISVKHPVEIYAEKLFSPDHENP